MRRFTEYFFFLIDCLNLNQLYYCAAPNQSKRIRKSNNLCNSISNMSDIVDSSQNTIAQGIDGIADGVSSKIHPIRSYFTYDTEIQRSVCKLGDCKLKTKSANDLYRHVMRKHNKDFEKDDIKNKVEGFRKKNNRTEMDEDDEIEVTVRVKRSQIIKSCVELTTINGRPLGLVEDSGFKRLMQPIVHAINQKSSARLTLNRDAMIQHAENELTFIKNRIKTETENRMVSLLIDSATKHDRYFLTSCVDSNYKNNYFSSSQIFAGLFLDFSHNITLMENLWSERSVCADCYHHTRAFTSL